MRVAIIGMGVAGSMAAWRLAQAGHEVVAFEQFSLDHDKGSSYGTLPLTVTRKTYIHLRPAQHAISACSGMALSLGCSSGKLAPTW